MPEEKQILAATDEEQIRMFFTTEISGRRREVTKYAADLRDLIQGDITTLNLFYRMRRHAPKVVIHENCVERGDQ